MKKVKQFKDLNEIKKLVKNEKWYERYLKNYIILEDILFFYGDANIENYIAADDKEGKVAIALFISMSELIKECATLNKNFKYMKKVEPAEHIRRKVKISDGLGIINDFIEEFTYINENYASHYYFDKENKYFAQATNSLLTMFEKEHEIEISASVEKRNREELDGEKREADYVELVAERRLRLAKNLGFTLQEIDKENENIEASISVSETEAE